MNGNDLFPYLFDRQISTSVRRLSTSSTRRSPSPVRRMLVVSSEAVERGWRPASQIGPGGIGVRDLSRSSGALWNVDLVHFPGTSICPYEFIWVTVPYRWPRRSSFGCPSGSQQASAGSNR